MRVVIRGIPVHSGALRGAPRHSASYNLELRGTPSADLDVRRRKLIRSNQWQSVAISGNQWQSVADLDVRRRKPAQDLIRSKRGREEGIRPGRRSRCDEHLHARQVISGNQCTREEGIRPGRRSRCDEHLQGRSSVAVSGHVPLLRPTITAIISGGEGLQQVRGQDRISSKGDPRGRRRSHQIEDGADEQHRIGHGW